MVEQVQKCLSKLSDKTKTFTISFLESGFHEN